MGRPCDLSTQPLILRDDQLDSLSDEFLRELREHRCTRRRADVGDTPETQDEPCGFARDVSREASSPGTTPFDEPVVILGRVDPDARLLNDPDGDRVPRFENAELLQLLGPLEW